MLMEPITELFKFSNAQILSCYILGGNIQFKAGPGAGKAFKILGVDGRINFNWGTPYDTHTQLSISLGGSPLFNSPPQFLAVDNAPCPIQQWLPVYPINKDDDQIVENGPMTLYCLTGNPQNGTGSVDIYVTYKIITLEPSVC